MDKIRFTEEQVEAVYDEVDRRLQSDIADGYFYDRNGHFDECGFEEYRSAMLQGVYSALMSLSNNWSDVVCYMINPIENQRYWTEESLDERN